jgi:hypothetical protein
MRRPILSSNWQRRALQLLTLAVALTSVACDNDVNLPTPTQPIRPFPPIGDRSLQISGSLTTIDGSCLAATILFDGQELAGGRSECLDPSGCAALDLSASTASVAGSHTVSFMVLEQSPKKVDYLADGTVLVTRNGLSLGGVVMKLGPKRSTLRQGDSVTFDVVFRD